MTTDESRKSLATVAVHLDSARGLLVQVRDEGPGGWPKAMENGEAAPSLEYRLHIDVRMLLEDFVEPGLSMARDTSRLTDAKVRREWEQDQPASLRR